VTRDDLKHLHRDDVPLWLAVETATWRLALAAQLPLRTVKPMTAQHAKTLAGYCTGSPLYEIRYALRNVLGKRYALHQLLDTIAHEVAHLKAGVKRQHEEKFFRDFAEMLTLAEDINIRVDLLASGTELEP
jgi:hypothetical protein